MPALFEIDRSASRGEVAEVLRAIADGVDDGTVTLEADGEEVEFAVPPELAYEIELETGDEADGVEVELEAELEWLAGEDRDAPVPAAHHEYEERAEESELEGGEHEDGDGEAGDTESASPELGGEKSVVGSEAMAGAPVQAEREAGSAARFELFTDRADEWRWRLVHDNGNVIADSGEGYSRKANARKGLESVRTNASAADVVEVSDGE